MRLLRRCHYRLVKGRDGDRDRCGSAGGSSSLLLGGWAMDHFLKSFAPLAFRKIAIIAIHLGQLCGIKYGNDWLFAVQSGCRFVPARNLSVHSAS
jgi:hypothetical protein